MNKSEIGELSLKILGICAFTGALNALQLPISWFQASTQIADNRAAWILSFVPAAALLLFSGILWLGAGRLNSSSKAAAAGPATHTSAITPDFLLNTAFSITGIFVLIGTLNLLPNYLNQLIAGMQGYQGDLMRLWLGIAVIAIRLALGFWLLFGARSMQPLKARLLQKRES
jgi:hypothetical protein